MGGGRRLPVTGWIRRDAAAVGREQPGTTESKVLYITYCQQLATTALNSGQHLKPLPEWDFMPVDSSGGVAASWELLRAIVLPVSHGTWSLSESPPMVITALGTAFRTK